MFLRFLRIFVVLVFIFDSVLCSEEYSNVVEEELDISDSTLKSDISGDFNGVGGPLLLTPLIQDGKLKQARKLAVVRPFLSDVHSYAGYLTVNKAYNSNMFFWFFKCAKIWEKAPVTVWLQGGPGASGLFGLFVENGPYIIKKKKLLKRFHSWHKDSNIIFIDNPVGTGFSFTDSDDGYAKNQTVIGEMLYNAVKQFFMLFPNLVKNKFFITGESYGGKYVPALGYTIHKYNSLPGNDFKINLQGIFIGNGLTDPVNMMKYGDYLYQLSLIDFNELKVFHEYEDKIRDSIKNKNWESATYLFGKMILSYVYYPQGSYFKNISGFVENYNFINEKNVQWSVDHKNFINSARFRKSVHVGDRTYNNPFKVAMNLKEDIMKSVLPWVVELLNHYRVMFYNGQLDIICAYPLTENFLKNMKWKGRQEYLEAKRTKWFVGKDIAGYYKTVGNLTEVLVRNAGHLVPTDQPLWGRHLFKKFLDDLPLTGDAVCK